MTCPHCDMPQTVGLTLLDARDWLGPHVLTRHCEHCREVMESITYEDSYERMLNGVRAMGARAREQANERFMAALARMF